MINCRNLEIKYGECCLFKNVNLNLLSNHRYAVVGANGAGKSTFLKMIAGDEAPTAGSIDYSNQLTIGMLRQDHFCYHDESVVEVVIAGNKTLAQALHDKEKILSKETISHKDGYRLAELEETILAMDGYTAIHRAEKILKGLGVNNDQHHGALSTLSGGYKLRVLLAQSLFQHPDILLLDEPTNHLDIVSIAWLENFLKTQYKGLLIFISHDREFINGSATHILDVDYAEITLYSGNYDSFLQKKDAIVEQKVHEISYKQQKIAEMQRYVDKYRASASRSKQALSRKKMIDRIEVPEVEASSRRSPAFAFQQVRQSGKQVLQAEGLSKTFNNKQLFSDVNLNLYRGQKCAIVGANGIGKSTIIKLLLGDLPIDCGEYKWSETASVGYFPQNFHELLSPGETLINWICQAANIDEIAARKALACMLFSGKDAYKKISVLSGGECTRLLFAKLIAQKHNVLVLDEPTNHMDIESIEGLVKALVKFPGTVLFVSHNRYFVQKLASSLIIITSSQVECYPGTYQDFIEAVGYDYLTL